MIAAQNQSSYLIHIARPMLLASFVFASLACDVEIDNPLDFPDVDFIPVQSGLDVDSPTARHDSLNVVQVSGVQTTCGSSANNGPEKLVDGDTTTSGWTSAMDTSSGYVSFMLGATYNLSGLRIHADHGATTGQGPQLVDVVLRASSGAELQTFFSVPLDEALQATDGNAGAMQPDLIDLGSVAGVRRVDIHIVDNWVGDAVSGAEQTIQIREVEFDGEMQSNDTSCDAPMLASVTIEGPITERDPVNWPVTDLCDGQSSASDGYASDIDGDEGTFVFAFDRDYTLDRFSVWNDFGVKRGQGATDITIDYVDAAGALIATVGPFVADAANELVWDVGDHFEHAVVAGVRQARVHVGDNLGADHITGLQNSLNLREMRFREAVTEAQSCDSDTIESVRIIEGFTESTDSRYGLTTICDDVASWKRGFASSPGEDAGVLEFVLAEPTDITGIHVYNDFGWRSGQGAKDPIFVMYNDNGFYTDFVFPTDAHQQVYGVDSMGGGIIPGIVRVEMIITDNFSTEGDDLDVGHGYGHGQGKGKYKPKGGALNTINIAEVEFLTDGD